MDWRPSLQELLQRQADGVPTDQLAAAFHETLARMIVAVAERTERERVVLSGGCFQNRLLAERSAALLGAAGFRVFQHQRIPPNDGGIALGQTLVAASQSSP